jgi:hypothetical protein
MLGWDVSVRREVEESAPNATDGLLLASWQTGPFGLQWLDELVKDGKAIDLGGNGYPDRYRVVANVLLPILTTGLQSSDSPPVVGDDYALPRGWSSRVKLNRQRISECADTEHLLVEAWDLS